MGIPRRLHGVAITLLARRTGLDIREGERYLAPHRASAGPSQTVDGLAGFDDHLTTILAEKRGNSRNFLEIRRRRQT